MYQVSKYFDKVILLLIFFLLVLFSNFFYIFNLKKNAISYNKYEKNIEKIELYNQNINNIFLHSYKYLDNDAINLLLQKYSQSIKDMKENPLTKTLKITNIEKITLKYKQKENLIEEFKTLNARVTSSLQYLHNLKDKILAQCPNTHSSINAHQLLETTLFKVANIFINPNVKSLNLEENLKEILELSGSNKKIKLLHRNINLFINDVKYIDKIIKANKKISIHYDLDKIANILHIQYQRNQEKIKIIIDILSLFSMLILIFFIKTYTATRKKQLEIDFLAYNDVLTKLPNRTAFERDIEKLISKQKQRFIILFIDLDRFKVVNDTLGHNIGDEMLKIIALKIHKIFGDKNTLYRMGGDEFVGIIQNINNIDSILKELVNKDNQLIKIDNYNLSSTFSIGIARYPKDGFDKYTLLKHADSAMYYAKDNGGNQFAYHNRALFLKIERQLNLEQELLKALSKKEFKLSYQPQYSLDNRRIIGVEALIRWNNKLLGSVSPEEFISVCEDIGIIIDLGYFIFEEACTQYMKWKALGINLDTIAINISSLQLYQKDAFEQFKKIIEESKIDAKNIELELTERHIMDYQDKKLTILDELKDLGCKISIDDFGTGYSSLSYLKYFNIDCIKIDKSFLEDVIHNPQNAKILNAIIILSKSLDYTVIAEGIETKEEEDLVKKYHCDNGQGYYFAKPMNSQSFIEFYQNHSS